MAANEHFPFSHSVFKETSFSGIIHDEIGTRCLYLFYVCMRGREKGWSVCSLIVCCFCLYFCYNCFELWIRVRHLVLVM